jgi:hypothetical protein
MDAYLAKDLFTLEGIQTFIAGFIKTPPGRRAEPV